MMQSEHGYNPDVLTCLANLSSDEIFTPPELVNKILDILPPELWSNKDARFLDPMTKSGVFLREIAKRLMKGLEKQIPDQEKRINHVFKNQIFGIAITELTALLARRSVYCSKTANGKYSVCNDFTDEQGNIRFNRIEHTWVNGKCKFCGASEENYERGTDLETHAYEFIHTYKPEELFNMKFDVIIGNPPYQLSDGGAQKSASPIYQLFIQQAIKLNPNYLIMIVPARWYNGGKGLDDFRTDMINDRRIRELHDFPDTTDCFPGVNIRGGVCYFLWERNYSDMCSVYNHSKNQIHSFSKRFLKEKDTDLLIRYNSAIDILRKVKEFHEESFSNLVSPRKPFGLATDFSHYSKEKKVNIDIKLYRVGEQAWISKNDIIRNIEWLDKYKVLVPYASPGDDSYPHLILSKPIVALPGEACTETYLVIHPTTSMEISQSISSYLKTKFCRFMILLAKSTQHITQKTYIFVPSQAWDRKWTDKELYIKYKISIEQQSFIDSLIKPIGEDNE